MFDDRRPFVPSRRALLAMAGVVAIAPQALAQSGRLRVVATTSMIADSARAVAGDAADVTALLGSGVDPHTYRQTRSDIAAMTGADLVFWHGLGLEAQLERFLRDLARRKPVAAVGEAVPVDRRIADEEYKDRPDPHVWMDPRLWSLVVDAVREALAKARPAFAQRFAAAADAHKAEIARLHDYSATVLATVPRERRLLITAHDAFSYFSRAYGFEVMGIQGISTESEAGLQRIRELVDIIVARRIGAIFVESSVSDRNIRALIEGAGSRGAQVAIGGELFSDAAGPAGTYEGGYVGMIDHNVTTIARALGGAAPERGMNGRLAAKG